MYDLIIIGGGPSAVTAGIYAARKRIKTLFLTKDWNGQMNWTNYIENYPGIESITGPELMQKMKKHLERYQGKELEIKSNSEVSKINLSERGLIKVQSNEEDFNAKTLIISTGRRYRKLGIPGEGEFQGKGVSYCPVCDAPLFQDKEVAVIGGGNAGAETAFDLAKYASKIYLLEFQSKLNCDVSFLERLKQEQKVEIITNAQVKEIKGDKLVNGLIYQNREKDEERELAIEGVFVEIGTQANSDLVKNVVELNQQGEIKINRRNQASVKNIFAAGDVTDVSHKQIIIAAGEGAKALLNAADYLQNNNL